jgi:hypothetical protein
MVPKADLQNLSGATLQLYSRGLSLVNYLDHAYAFLDARVPCDLINFGVSTLQQPPPTPAALPFWPRRSLAPVCPVLKHTLG